MPEHIPYVNRQYVMGEVSGIVDISFSFTGLDRTKSDVGAPHSHSLKMKSGKIRDVHSASACFVDEYGRNGTGLTFEAVGRRRAVLVGSVLFTVWVRSVLFTLRER